MAKIIEQPSGEKLIVSDDMPELDFDDRSENISKAAHGLLLNKNIIDPLNVLFFFNHEEQVSFPFQIKEYRKTKTKTKISGVMLITDFLWMISNKNNILTKIESRMPNRNYIIFDGATESITISAKDMNAIVCTAVVSFVHNT